MDFKQLESFIAVVDFNSFSKAAEKLFLTQPTITTHIQSLEQELGIVLFDRSNKRIMLTDSGNMLYKYATDIINLRDTALMYLSKNFEKVEGNLEITTSSIPGEYLIPYIIKDFINKYSNIKFKIIRKNSEKVIEDIRNGYVNFGIIGGKYDFEFLECIDFFDDNLVVITPNTRSYPSDINELDIDFLFKEKVIIREKGSSTRLLIEKALEDRKIKLSKLNIISSIEDNETIKRLVELGVGISIISELAVKKEIELGLVKAYYLKDFNLRRKFYFVYHKNRYLSPIDQAFKNFIVNYIDKMETVSKFV